MTDSDSIAVLLEQEDHDAIVQRAQRSSGKVLRYLTGRLYSEDEEQKWRAVRALGAVVADPTIVSRRRVSDLLTRFFWAMNDESGAVPFGVPEAIGEILARRPEFQEQHLQRLCSMVTHEDMIQTGPIERGVIWALGRVGAPVAASRRDAVRGIDAAAQHHPETATREVAAEALRRILDNAPGGESSRSLADPDDLDHREIQGRRDQGDYRDNHQGDKREKRAMPTYAVIDVGSNSLKLRVEQQQPDGTWCVLEDRNEITGLGKGLQASGRLSEQAMARNIIALGEFVAQARELGAQEIVAVGTMCLRSARNAADFVRRAQQACGVRIEIISGDEEARISHLAVLSGLGVLPGKGAIFDTGGGSTEFIFVEGGTILERFSLDIGAIRLTETYLCSDPVTPGELKAELAAISEFLHDVDVGRHTAQRIDTLVGVGGTLTTLGAIQQEMATYDAALIQGAQLMRGEVERQISMFRERTIAERRKIIGLPPKRADVILAGASIVLVIMQKLQVDSLTISARGLRHGVMYDRFQRP